MKNRLLALTLVGLASQAMANGLFFSEYIEGSSNNKALEIYNATGAAVDLSLVTVKTYTNGAVVPTYTLNLSGSLAIDDVYVIANASANATILAQADITSSVTFYNGDDAVELIHNGTSVDVIGIIGNDPGTNWPVGSGATSEFTLVRNSNVCDGTLIWAGQGNTQWAVFPQNTATYLGAHTAFCAGGNVPPIIGTISYTPNPLTPAASVTFDATITDSDGSVALAILYFGTTPGSLTNSVLLDPVGGDHFVNSAPITAPGACQTLYYKVEATDDDADVSVTGEYSAGVQCLLTIAQIQGGVSVSPYNGVTVTTEGQVTYIQTASSMFIQDGDGPWNGVQVFGSHTGVLEGDFIRVTGSVLEYQGFTEVTGSLSIQVLASPGPLTITPTPVTLAQANLEDYESVLVHVDNAVCVDAANFLVFDMTDQIKIYFPAFTPVEDDCYNITGVRYSFSFVNEILPRTIDEIQPCGVVNAGDLAGSFALGQAWPNPFNPTALIAFNLDRTAPARLSVFNVLGQEVAVLAEGLLEAGRHQVSFNAAGLPSGLYFYNLQSEGRQLTGRMLLVR